jgi:hypothetical protein
MIATYQANTTDLNASLVDTIKHMFVNRAGSIRVEDEGERYTREGLLVREGVTIPKGEEDDSFYSSANIQWMKQGAKEADEGKFAKTFNGDEWKTFVVEHDA